MSLDLDEPEPDAAAATANRIMTYDGLESCILGNQSCEESEGRTSNGAEEGYPTDSLDDNSSSCSSKDATASGSFSSTWMATTTRDDEGLDEWEATLEKEPLHHHSCLNEKTSVYAVRSSDIETMKETFSKLLLGEDVTGGRKGISSALALSNAIINLAASVFGELWKLEPLSGELKNRWKREKDWFLSPAKYMVELVPAKQNGANGCTMEIMIPQTRADVHMYLPALQQLDSMLIEILDSMVDTDFWYAERGSRKEGKINNNSETKHSKKWWLPSPCLPTKGLSQVQAKKLLYQGKTVHQIFKAAKSINESVLLSMPLPVAIKNALPKSGRESVGEGLYRHLTSESVAIGELLSSLNLKSEHHTLQLVNRLEAAVLTWSEQITQHVIDKSPVRTSWTFLKDPLCEQDKIELLLDRAECLLQYLKKRHPNLPQTFISATKVHYGKDVALSILEAYSRVISNLAFSILSRIAEIFQEDALSNPSSRSPVELNCLPEINLFKLAVGNPSNGSYSLIHQMKRVDEEYFCANNNGCNSMAHSEVRTTKARVGRGRPWCIGRKGFSIVS